MNVNLQCSGCGRFETDEPENLFVKGWRATGVPYCPECAKNIGNNDEANFYLVCFDWIETHPINDVDEVKDKLNELGKINDTIYELIDCIPNEYKEYDDSIKFSEIEDLWQENDAFAEKICDTLEDIYNELSDLIYDMEYLINEN